MEKWRENKKAYNKEYKKTKIKTIQLDFNIEKDSDILEALEKNKPVIAYIRQLVRNDIKKYG